MTRKKLKTEKLNPPFFIVIRAIFLNGALV